MTLFKDDKNVLPNNKYLIESLCGDSFMRGIQYLFEAKQPIIIKVSHTSNIHYKKQLIKTILNLKCNDKGFILKYSSLRETILIFRFIRSILKIPNLSKKLVDLYIEFYQKYNLQVFPLMTWSFPIITSDTNYFNRFIWDKNYTLNEVLSIVKIDNYNMIPLRNYTTQLDSHRISTDMYKDVKTARILEALVKESSFKKGWAITGKFKKQEGLIVKTDDQYAWLKFENNSRKYKYLKKNVRWLL